jgi:hypothetical protein
MGGLILLISRDDPLLDLASLAFELVAVRATGAGVLSSRAISRSLLLRASSFAIAARAATVAAGRSDKGSAACAQGGVGPRSMHATDCKQQCNPLSDFTVPFVMSRLTSIAVVSTILTTRGA